MLVLHHAWGSCLGLGHDPCYLGRVLHYSYHMEQHLTPHLSTPFSSHNTCSHRWTIDLHIFYNNGIKGGLPLVISMVQFGLAVVVTLLFTIIPSRRMFGDRVASKPQKYLASQTFMASYPTLSQNMHMMSFTFGFSSSCASLWSSQASWIRPLHESGHDHTCNYVCDGSHAVLPGYILVVCHLEYGVQHCTFVHPGVVNLDTLE